METEKVSVIIPVYNVEDYLEQCLASVAHQTYSALEIYLINDGSTDHSLERCRKWAERDDRIRVISKENEGLGPTRNLGIRLAKTRYIAFLDSDDWWDETMIEKMYQKAVSSDADMVICDRYDATYQEETGEFACKVVKTPAMFMDMGKLKNTNRYIHLIGNSAWGRLYKRELFIDNHIFMPNVYCEDAAIMPFLACHCKKIEVVREPLYYYRQKRRGSILNSMNAARTMVTCLKFVKKEFTDAGLFEEYELPLRWLAYEFSVGTMRTTEGLLTEENRKTREEIIEDLSRFLESNYPDPFGTRFILGSYNLRRAAMFGFPCMEKWRKHFCSSSIVSLFSKPIRFSVEHPNRTRQDWINDDLNKRFLNEYSIGKNDLILIDFLEERYDIACCGDSYFTYSEPFMEIEQDFLPNFRVIKRDSEEMEKLWREKCDMLVNFLKERADLDRVILVEMYLSEKYGDYCAEREFKEIEEIRTINQILRGYYQYFEERLPAVRTVKCESENFFTDAAFTFGGYPYHLNEGYYTELGDRIRKTLEVKHG